MVARGKKPAYVLCRGWVGRWTQVAEQSAEDFHSDHDISWSLEHRTQTKEKSPSLGLVSSSSGEAFQPFKCSLMGFYAQSFCCPVLWAERGRMMRKITNIRLPDMETTLWEKSGWQTLEALKSKFSTENSSESKAKRSEVSGPSVQSFQGKGITITVRPGAKEGIGKSCDLRLLFLSPQADGPRYSDIS